MEYHSSNIKPEDIEANPPDTPIDAPLAMRPQSSLTERQRNAIKNIITNHYAEEAISGGLYTDQEDIDILKEMLSQ